MRNTFGNLFTLTTFGESHGEAIGGVVDGMPAGIDIDMNFIQAELNRRRPGQSPVTTARREKDEVELLSGIFEGKSTGTPICFIVRNHDARPEDYENLRHLFRPSHADYTYHYKYGNRDFRGGGRSSARITLSRCVGGALAKLVLRKTPIRIYAYTSRIGNLALSEDYKRYDASLVESNPMRCPDPETARQMEAYVKELKMQGDSTGGIVTCVIQGCPAGLGEPEFGKLHAGLGAAMLSINAVKGFEYGEGFGGATLRGSQQNDAFVYRNGVIATETNHSGGIQGGISNGEDIYFRVALKPTPTISKQQETIDDRGNAVRFAAGGRHDSCIVPRAVPIIEAMAAMTILDYLMLSETIKL